MNGLRSTGLKSYIRVGILLLFIGIFISFLSIGIWKAAAAIPPSLIFSILPYSFLLMIGMLILLGTPQVFKNLYASTDLSLLFTMPIPTRQLFWIKYIKSYLSTPLFLLVLLFVPFTIYGVKMQINWLFYPTLFVVLFSFSLIGLSISYLINLVLIQIIPARRANELMTALSFLSGLLTYGLFQIPNMLSEKTRAGLLAEGLPLFPAWTPMSWGSRAITNAMDGSLQLLLPTIAIVLVAGGISLLSSTLVEKGFRTGWIQISEGRSIKKKKRKKPVQKQKIIIRLLPSD